MKSIPGLWVLLCAVTIGGCRDGDGTADPTDPPDDAAPLCIPGASQACECDGGAMGAEVCDEEGLGYGTCECIGTCGPPSSGAAPLRRLTRSQYANTVVDLLGVDASIVAEGLAPDERIGPFKSNVTAPIAELQVEQYMDGAEQLAAAAAQDLDALLPCSPQTQGELACAEAFVRELAPRAYRRPVDEDEIDELLDVYAATEAATDFEGGIRVVVQTILQSPYFLYHVERGVPNQEPTEGEALELTSHEYASRLSYFLWNTMPDEELSDAAATGALDDLDGRRAQAQRLLADPRAAEGIANFHLQWLGVDELDAASKSAEVFPQFDDALADAMMEETADFARYVLEQDDGRLETLLTAPYTVTDDDALLSVYGATRPAGQSSGEPVPLSEDERAGLLTQASVLTVHSHPNQSSPVLRGVMLRQNVLCQPLPPPPPNVDNVPPDPDPNATTRERFAQHTENPECASCHALIDPLGFGLEHYDAIGTFRDSEGGLPIDATGTLVATDVDGQFDGAVELAGMLASSADVRDCVGRQWLRFALGRAETEADQCTTDTLLAGFAASDGDVRALITDVALSDAFRHIATPQ